jgi:hypothetical protein
VSEHDDFAAALAACATADPFALIYRATVILQHADGTLDLRLVGTQLEPRRVRLDVGIPGCRVIVDPGTEVKLAFAGGSPEGAYAFGIPLDPAGSRGLVRVGDLGDGGFFTALGVAPGAPIIFQYSAPGGLLPTGAPDGAIVQIVTKATNGSAKVMIR